MDLGTLAAYFTEEKQLEILESIIVFPSTKDVKDDTVLLTIKQEKLDLCFLDLKMLTPFIRNDVLYIFKCLNMLKDQLRFCIFDSIRICHCDIVILEIELPNVSGRCVSVDMHHYTKALISAKQKVPESGGWFLYIILGVCLLCMVKYL